MGIFSTILSKFSQCSKGHDLSSQRVQPHDIKLFITDYKKNVLFIFVCMWFPRFFAELVALGGFGP